MDNVTKRVAYSDHFGKFSAYLAVERFDMYKGKDYMPRLWVDLIDLARDFKVVYLVSNREDNMRALYCLNRRGIEVHTFGYTLPPAYSLYSETHHLDGNYIQAAYGADLPPYGSGSLTSSELEIPTQGLG